MIKDSNSQFSTTINPKSICLNTEGENVLQHTLRNKNGIELTVMNYGATITALKIPTKNNEIIDVVLGFDTLEDYKKSFQIEGAPYFGAVIGRYAGRINNGTFNLNGKQIQLNKNHGKHTLHGGLNSFSNVFWKVISVTNKENPSIQLEYISADNEENFPGELSIKVTYTLFEENELSINYWATTSEDTIVNLTQHSYFNLEGHKGCVLNQELEIYSNKMLEINSENIPTGNYLPINQTLFDFSSPKKCPESIDNSFIIEKENALAASLSHSKNGLKMNVYTNQPSVHIYVGGNCSKQIKGKENTNYHATSGICFETQNFPDAPNHAHFPNSVLKKGEKYHQKTIFKFENI